MAKVRLSPSEAKMILHRLEVPDAIAEKLGMAKHWERVYEAAGVLESRVNAGDVWFDNALERAVLWDAVASSVWWAVSEEDASYSRHANLLRANIERTVISATRKVAELVGKEIEPVLW